MKKSLLISSSHISYKKGMTLVELMVVLSIFVIIAGITMFDYGNFRTSVSLQNLADDIGLSIRKVQSYAIGVHSTNLQDFKKGFGIHFSTAPSTNNIYAGWNKNIIIFYDANTFPNRKYDISTNCGQVNAGDQNECNEVYDILTQDIVYDICPGGTCPPTLPQKQTSYVDITFLRPNPDAIICAGIIGSDCDTTSYVDIWIKNNISGQLKKITVTNTGQISIQ